MGGAYGGGGVMVEGIGGEAKSGELKPYCYWRLSVGKYSSDLIKSDLIKALEEAGLKRGGLLRKNRLRSGGIEVRFESENSHRMEIMKINLYSGSDEKGEKMENFIQEEINKMSSKSYSILRVDRVRYEEGKQVP